VYPRGRGFLHGCAGHGQRRHVWRRELHLLLGRFGTQQHQAWFITAGEHAARRVSRHPATVKGDAERAD
jgi:hypothetical protein